MAPTGSEFCPLEAVPILKKDIFEENHYSLQYVPFEVRKRLCVLVYIRTIVEQTQCRMHISGTMQLASVFIS